MPLVSLALSCFLVAQAPAPSPNPQEILTDAVSPPASIAPIPDPMPRETAPLATQPQSGSPGLFTGPAAPLQPAAGGGQAPLLLPSAADQKPAAPPASPSPSPSPPSSPRQPEASPAPTPKPAATPAPSAGTKPAVAQPPAGQADSARRRLPPDMVASMLKLPEESKLTGRPMPLVEALANAYDRAQRLAITHAYWRLTNTLAEYHLCAKELAQLRQLQVRPDDAMLQRTALASAEAALRAAEVAVVAAQYDLAEAVGLSGQATLPLPADLPHVGPYRTNFEVVAARQVLPPRTRLIDRMMPIRRKAVDVWASAVQAAEDAAEAVSESYQKGATDLATVLEYQALLGRRQRSFMAAVCDYNHDIADYAITVAGPEIAGPALVSMLIKTSEQAAPRTAPSGAGGAAPLQGNPETFIPLESGVRPAAHQAPVPDNVLNTLPSRPGRPTLAPPRDRLQPMGRNVPTLAPPRESAKSPEAGRPTLAPPRGEWKPQQPAGVPTLAPPREAPAASEADPPAESTRDKEPQPAASEDEQPATLQLPENQSEPNAATQSLLPIRFHSSSTILRTAYKPALEDAATAQATAGLYPGLVDASPTVQAKRLAESLFRAPTSSFLAGKAIPLGDCLRDARTGDRRELIGAYWRVQQRAAEYQALVMHDNWLAEFLPFALQHRNQPHGPEEMLRLRAAQLAVEAHLLDAQLQFLAAQYDLTQQAGAPIDSAWLSPQTIPHAGPYLLRLEAQPPQLTATLPVQRLAATIPSLSANVQDRARSVVQADVARAAAAAAYQSGQRPLDDALAAMNLQTSETHAFLETVTEYNRAIANYVLLIAPPTVPAEKLVEAMVVVK
jgi:hypothetical protein